jgi:NAD(P)-dependent dehydrogenase (short-subunit alcohol dehydrogenase family)
MGMNRALVTGGSRGIGFEIARGLRTHGIDTTILGQERERVSKAAEELGVAGICADVRDYNKLQELNESLAPFDILVLSHGVMSEKMSKTIRATKEDWNRTLDINLTGVFNVVNIFGQHLVENRNGRVVVLSACLGRMSGPGNAGGLAPYRISKAGVNAFVRNFAHETGLGSRGVLVDATCPNHSRTDMGGPDAPRSAAEGAETAIWLATRSYTHGVDQTGLLWEDREVVPW